MYYLLTRIIVKVFVGLGIKKGIIKVEKIIVFKIELNIKICKVEIKFVIEDRLLLSLRVEVRVRIRIRFKIESFREDRCLFLSVWLSYWVVIVK